MKTNPPPAETQKHLSDASAHYRAASALREELAVKHGCGEYPNRLPVSGGICQHWPRREADKVCVLVRNAQESVELARKAWRKAGRQDRTFRRLLAPRGII